MTTLLKWLGEILNLKVELPIIDGTTDEIDFDYMDAYISELEQEHINELDTLFKELWLDNCELPDDDKKILNIKKNIRKYKIIDIF